VPLVSVIVPTFNRARLIAEALASIEAQTLSDWEVIVIDDGGTDRTDQVVQDWTRRVKQDVTYVRQENQGPGAARNNGLDRARGRYVAFLDSDDLWIPHHLEQCVAALEAHPEIGWVFSASRMVDDTTGKILSESNFTEGGRREFLGLRFRSDGDLRIIDDPGLVCCAIEHGLHAGFQTSVYRREPFKQLRIPPFRIGEDGAYVLMALKAGPPPGYFMNVHSTYRVHGGNSSSPRGAGEVDDRIAKARTFISALEFARDHAGFNPDELRSFRRRLAHFHFWRIGYALNWSHGRRRDALASFRTAFRYWPWSAAMWKTYLLCLLRPAKRS
jgi:glycosyltransferase involved in cell wall biosynthesis